MIVQALRDIQTRYGYLPERELEFLALRARVPLYRVQEVASFFPSFRLHPPPDVTVQICRDMACHLHGAARLLAETAKEFGDPKLPPTVTVEGVSCLGRCDRAPVACVSRHGANLGQPFHDRLYTELGSGNPPKALSAVLSEVLEGAAPEAPHRDSQGETPSWTIDIYHPPGNEPAPPATPFAAVKTFLRDPEGTKLLERLEDAVLVGMGGALARTGKKWKEVQKEVATPKYVVCNGDESEPGTFKDRELLLHTPDLVVEGLLLAGLFLQAERGYFYIRHEYHEQIEAVRRSILRARQAVPEAFRSFDLEVFVSPGGYICGEQSALLEAIEARRAQPRNEPPKIATNGLFDKPTLVNNVETLAWIPGIVVHGVDWYKKEKLRFFSVSGDVEKPGVYEVSTEQTLGHLIMTRAGGIRGNRALRAIASSGPSGGFLLPVLEALALRQIIEKKLPGSADGRRRRRPTWRNSRSNWRGKTSLTS